MSYNLSDNVNDNFSFKLKGVEYVMRYPLVEEIEQLQALIDTQNAASTPEEKAASGKEMQEYMYSFISPVSEGSESISDAMKKSNIKVMMNFNTMVKTEFGVN